MQRQLQLIDELHQRPFAVGDVAARFRIFATRVGNRYRKRVLVDVQTNVCIILCTVLLDCGSVPFPFCSEMTTFT